MKVVNFAIYLAVVTAGLAAWNYRPYTLIDNVPLDFWWGWAYYAALFGSMFGQFRQLSIGFRIFSIISCLMVMFNVWGWIAFLGWCYVFAAVVYAAVGLSIIISFFYGVFEGIKDQLNKKD